MRALSLHFLELKDNFWRELFLPSVINTVRVVLLSSSGRVAQRITRLTTDQKIAGSNPAAIEKTLLQTLDWRTIQVELY